MLKQTDAQALGRRGERWFVGQLPDRWIFQFPSEDVGIDGVVVLAEAGFLNGTEFRVQIKASSSWETQDGRLMLRNVKRTQVRYWVASLAPTMLVLYDASGGRGYYAWVQDLVDDWSVLLKGQTETLTLKVPTDAPLDQKSWPKIREYLTTHWTGLKDALSSARSAVVVMDTLHALAEASRGLHFAAHAKPPDGTRTEEQGRLVCLLETVSHRDVVLALRGLVAQLDRNCQAWKDLNSFISTYVAEVATFIHPFDQLLERWDADSAIAINEQQMRKSRSILAARIFDVLVTLSNIGRKPDGRPGTA